MIELQRASYGQESEAVLREIADYCGRYDEPMQADCLVNYRRMPWQDDEGNLRVTLDVGLEFYPPPADLWERRHPLVRESLGPVGRPPGRRRAGAEVPGRAAGLADRAARALRGPLRALQQVRDGLAGRPRRPRRRR